MADFPTSNSGNSPSGPGQQITPTNGSNQALPSADEPHEVEFESPVFDLHADEEAAASMLQTEATPVVVSAEDRFSPDANTIPGQRVQVGRETIPIAPHPTTNRYPWKPVENPTVPVYGTVQEQAPEPPAPAPEPVAVAQPTLEPPAFEVSHESAPAEVEAPQPEPVVVAAAPPEPTPQPTPEPEPAAAPPPQPEAAPLPEPTPEPVIMPAPMPEQQPQPAAKPKRHHNKRIYSVDTREVWGVMRFTKTFKFIIVLVTLGIIAAAILFWVSTGASLDNLPFMDELLKK